MWPRRLAAREGERVGRRARDRPPPSQAPHAVAASKALVFGVGGKEITPELIDYTADQLATIRVKGEAVVGMKALLAKQKPGWAKEPLKVKL